MFYTIYEELIYELIIQTKDERLLEPLIWHILDEKKIEGEKMEKIKEIVNIFGKEFWDKAYQIEIIEREEIKEWKKSGEDEIEDWKITEELREKLNL